MRRRSRIKCVDCHVGSGARSLIFRTYYYLQRRLTVHSFGLTIHRLPETKLGIVLLSNGEHETDHDPLIAIEQALFGP